MEVCIEFSHKLIIVLVNIPARVLFGTLYYFVFCCSFFFLVHKMGKRETFHSIETFEWANIESDDQEGHIEHVFFFVVVARVLQNVFLNLFIENFKHPNSDSGNHVPKQVNQVIELHNLIRIDVDKERALLFR